MSDRPTRRPSTVERPRQRQRGPRSARKRAASAPPVQPIVAASAPAAAAPALATRSRRGVSAAFKPRGLSREEEFAYIRSDMRRLLIVAGGLLALMVVILFIVER